MIPSFDLETLGDMLGVAAIAVATIAMLWLPALV